MICTKCGKHMADRNTAAICDYCFAIEVWNANKNGGDND